MAKLIAVLIAYNEADMLPGCLSSVYGKCDEIVMVEGRISAFPGDNIHSSDNTITIAKEYGATVITNKRAWANECEMRSAYLMGNEGDVYFHIDADERCMTPLPRPEQLPGDVYSVNVVMIDSTISQLRPRFFRHRGTMKYNGVHDALWSDGMLISSPPKVPTLHSVWLAHMHRFRSADRRKEKTIYYNEGYKHEGELRKEWGIYNVKR